MFKDKDNPKAKRELKALLDRLMLNVDAVDGLADRAIDIYITKLLNLAEEERESGKDFNFNKYKVNYKKPTEIFIARMEKVVRDLIGDMNQYSLEITRRFVGKENKDKFNATEFLAIPIMGITLSDRIKAYANEIANDVRDFARVGFENDISKHEMRSIVLNDKGKLTNRDDVKDAIIAGYASFEGVNPYYKLKRMAADTVLRGMHATNAHNWVYAVEKEIVVHIDEYTCERCLALDGKRFMVHEQILPVHPNCRCQEIPIVNSNRI